MPGRILGAGFVTCFTARFLIEFIKEEQVPFEQSMRNNVGQLLSIPFVAGGIFLVYFSSKILPAKGQPLGENPPQILHERDIPDHSNSHTSQGKG